MAALTRESIRSIVQTIRRGRNRPRDSAGRPGGLVELPRAAVPIIVGDLHSCTENLRQILEHDDNEKRIKRGERVLVLLGDLVHNDQTGQLREMASSLETLEFVFGLFAKYGNKVIHLRGNHDSFDENLVKSGIRQGLEFYNHVVEKRGPGYTKAVGEYFDALPVFIIGEGYVITHAGPIRGGATRFDLINIQDDPGRSWQLQWNRINEFGGTPSMKEYDAEDIRATLQKLGLPQSTQFIVGHNPLWNTGNRTGVWLNVLGISGHHILYSGAQTRAPYFTFEGGKLVTSYAIPAKAEAYYA